MQNQSVQDWEDEGTTLARQFSTVLVYDAEEGVWRPTDASWKHLVFLIDLYGDSFDLVNVRMFVWHGCVSSRAPRPFHNCQHRELPWRCAWLQGW